MVLVLVYLCFPYTRGERMKKFFIIAAVMLAVCCLGYGADELLRPVPSVSGETGLFEIYEAHTLGFKQFAVQVSWDDWERDPGNLDVTEEALSFCYGLTNKLEVALSIRAKQVDASPDLTQPAAYYLGHSVDRKEYYTGTGNPHFGIKYNFLKEKAGRPGLAVLGYADLPRSDEDTLLGAGKAEYGVSFIASKRLGPAYFSANLGYERLKKTDLPVSTSQPDLGLYGLGVRVPVTKRFQGIGEVSGYWYLNDRDNLNQDEHLDIVVGAQLGFLNGWGFAGGVRYTPHVSSDNGYGGVFKISYTTPGEKIKEDDLLGITEGGTPGAASADSQPEAVNLPPNLKVASDSTIVEEGKTAKVRALASDPDGDLLTYSWKTDKGRIIGSGPEVVWVPEKGQIGPAKITSKVSDGRGGTSEDSLALNVIRKQPPVREFPPVFFEFDKYGLDQTARKNIEDICNYLKEYPELKLKIEGHCCYIGTDEYNLALGQHRADAIQKYMIESCGLDESRIGTISYGESKPAYDNSKEDTRKYNRRGEFRIKIER